MKQVAELASKMKPFWQEVQIPDEQSLQPGVQSFTYPLITTELIACVGLFVIAD